MNFLNIKRGSDPHTADFTLANVKIVVTKEELKNAGILSIEMLALCVHIRLMSFLKRYAIIRSIRYDTVVGERSPLNHMERFTENALQIIRSIPAGHVMTYGQVARLAGSPRAARQVVRILHSMSKSHKLPWHRVVNAKGEIAIKDDVSSLEQRLSLESEGIEITADRFICLDRYQYHPQ